MKAARWVDIGRVECEDVPVPPVADGQVLVADRFTRPSAAPTCTSCSRAPRRAPRTRAIPGTRASARWWSRAAPGSSRATAC